MAEDQDVHTLILDTIVDTKIVGPHLTHVEHVIVSELWRFKILLKVEGNYIHSILTLVSYIATESSFLSPGVNCSLENNQKIIFHQSENFLLVYCKHRVPY